MTTTPFSWAEFEAEASDPANHIAFTPVPRQRARRGGWSAERQKMFLFALSRCGSVARAARSVGLSPRGAHRLVHAPGAEDFARAWDRAIDEGIERVRADALERALGGAFVPVFRRGKLVRVEHRRCDRLALALLGGKAHGVDDNRRSAVSRRDYWAELRAADEVRAAAKRAADGVWDEHQKILDRIELERLLGRRLSPPKPQVRRL